MQLASISSSVGHVSEDIFMASDCVLVTMQNLLIIADATHKLSRLASGRLTAEARRLV
jgi:hypothetical protein